MGLDVIHAHDCGFIVVDPLALRSGIAPPYLNGGGYRLLPLHECRSALWQIRHNDHDAHRQLLEAFGLDGYEDAWWAEQRLEDLLGPGGWDDLPGPFARMCILERLPPERTAQQEVATEPTFQPAPLSATQSSVTIECVDERDGQTPVRGVELEVITGAGDVRRVASDGEGIAFVEGIAPGTVRIRVLSVHGRRWRPAEGAASVPSARASRISWHEVRRGDCLGSIAHGAGLQGWRMLWELPENAPLQRKRKSPHVLRPGDMVAVPALEVFELERPTDSTHRILIEARPPRRVRMRLRSLAGEPLANVPYVYSHDLQDEETAGSAPTTNDGWLEERVPMSARALKLRLTERPQALTLRFGHLEPVRDEDTGEPNASGVQARLRALGYDLTTPSKEKEKQALETFQALELDQSVPTGEPDARTLQALADAASCEAPVEGDAALCGDEALAEMSATMVALRIGALAGPCEAWRFEAVPEGAFVIVRPEHTALQLRGITQGDRGEVHQFCGDDKASRTPSQPLYLFAPGRYFVWWTFHEEAFAQALEEPTRVQHLENVIEVKQYHARGGAPLRRELEQLAMRDDIVHTVCEHILYRHPFYEGRSAPIFDVTPPPMRALCTVELMQWFTRRSNEASANDLATLTHASAMVEAAEKGLLDLQLERGARELFPTAEERRVFEAFRDYVWRCAATGRRRGLVGESLAMQEGPADYPQGGMLAQPSDAGLDAGGPAAPATAWLEAASSIMETSRGIVNGPAVHPYFQGVQGPLRGLVREGVTLSIDQQTLLMSYYDSYMFGAALRTTTIDCDNTDPGPSTYRTRMAGRMRDWSRKLDLVCAHAHRLLEQHADVERFVVTHADAYPYEETLLERYEAAARFAGYAWWTSLRTSEQNAAPARNPDGTFSAAAWPFWKSFKARIKPFAESAKGSGKLCKLLGERAAAYKFAQTKAEQMLDTLGRLEVTLAGADVDATTHVLRTEDVLASLEPTGEAGEVRVALQGQRTAGAPSHVTLRFVKPTSDSTPGGVPAPSSGDRGTKMHRPQVPTQRAWKLSVARREYLDELGRFSKPFAVLGETLNLAIAVATIADAEAKGKDKLTATFDVTKGLVGVVEGLPGALSVLAPEVTSRQWFGSAKKTAGGLKGFSTWLSRIDHVGKVYKGLSILCSSESAVDYELRQGRVFRARTQRFTDIANVVLGAASAAELAGTAAASLGAAEFLGWSTTLLAGFSATPWGLLLSVGGGLIAAGSTLVFDLAQPWDKRLMAIEEQLASACQAEVRDHRLFVSTRIDALLGTLEAT